jgi:hypothetical protein
MKYPNRSQLLRRAKSLPKIAVRLMFGVVLFSAASGAHALTCTSTAAVNNWSTVATWSGGVGNCNRVPINGDDVIISAGGTTTLDVNSATLASLTVNGTLIVASTLNVNNTTASFLTINNGGTVTIGNNATGRAVTVAGDITVAGTGTFTVGATAATHTLTAGGNITNAGTINFRPSATRLCNVTFNENGNQTVSGAGAYTFNLITLNMGATRANTLDMQSAMTVPSPFLTITNGTYKHSNTSNITPWTADPNIPANGGFWLNGNATVTTTGFNVTVNGGLFRISAGTMNIGNANTTLLVLNNAATTLFQMDSGALTVTGGINSSTNAAAGTFTMSGGTITLMTVSAGAVYTVLLGSATTLNWSGGTIIAVNGNNTTDDVDIRSATQNVTGGTLQLGSAATTSANDISYINGAGGQLNVWNLVLASGPARNILMRSSTSILNDLTIQTLNNLNPGAGLAINIGAGNTSGNWTNNGTFTQGTTTVTFTGTSNTQAIGGTAATTFNNLTINKASNNLTINTTPTVNGTLTFTSGDIVTGANRVILGTAATVATPSATSYVFGTVQKNYSAAGTLTFPVGDANNYTPVTIQGTAGFTAGSLSINTTGNDHPQVTTPIASTGIDANKSVNRFWTLTANGLPAASTYNATFNFINATPVDLDAGATAANFIVERYDGTNWNPTTLGVAGASSTSITGVANLYGDFAVGEPVSGITPVPGRFNAFETSTPANSLLGKIYTKLAGVAFSLDVVSINAAKTAYGGAVANVTVALLDSSNNTGALDVNGCRPTWTVVQTFTTVLNIPASGRVTLGGMTVANAYRDARLRISSAGPLIGCSTDRFTIRPQSFIVTSTNAGNNNTTGAPAIKTGANFNLTAASVVGYDGAPIIDSTKVAGTPTAGTIGGSFSAAPVATGTATGASFFYSEVGNFGLNANAVYDPNFTSVDKPNDCTNDFSNALVGGKYGCSFGSAAVAQTTGVSGFGRFIPDNFNVSYNAPQFGTGCGTFTYVGKAFTYAIAPVITVTARNGTNNGLTNATTTNYAGAYMKFSNAAGTSLNQAPYDIQGGRYSRFDALGGGSTPTLDVTGLPATTADPTVGVFTNGVGTLTFGSGTGLIFTRGTPNAPFNADIALALNVIDTDGVTYAGNPASVGVATSGNGMAFSNGKEMRYGRLVLQNAFGSELLPIPNPINGTPVLMQTQYYVDANTGFVTNTQDGCTTVAPATLSLANTTAPTPVSPPTAKTVGTKTTTATIANAPFINGDAGLSFSAPGTGGDGYVDVQVAVLNYPWLRYDWNGNNNYNEATGDDPSSRITFGLYRGSPKHIYIRERY